MCQRWTRPRFRIVPALVSSSAAAPWTLAANVERGAGRNKKPPGRPPLLKANRPSDCQGSLSRAGRQYKKKKKPSPASISRTFPPRARSQSYRAAALVHRNIGRDAHSPASHEEGSAQLLVREMVKAEPEQAPSGPRCRRPVFPPAAQRTGLHPPAGRPASRKPGSAIHAHGTRTSPIISGQAMARPSFPLPGDSYAAGVPADHRRETEPS